MFGGSYKKKCNEMSLAMLELRGQSAAINRSQAVIEFNLQGEVLTANDNFLAVMGYRLEEIQGKHHRMFVAPTDAVSQEYRAFWDRLARGEYDAGQYKRVTRDGREVWLQASYNPVLGEDGRPCKVIKFASDISETKRRNADFEGQIAAISKVMAVVEFGLDGRVINANENFLKVLGYSLDEIRGQHHRLFVDPKEHAQDSYRIFWEKLSTGHFDAGRYRRLGKGGREIWIQASYNPIMDANGHPVKVVKYATEITEEVRGAQILEEAIRRTEEVVQAAQTGDLTKRVELTNASEGLQKLAASVNSLVDTVVQIVSEVDQAAEAINVAAKEIALGNSDLSRRTEQQAASLEETASSMEEMTGRVKGTAQSAQQANQLGNSATQSADRGREVVQGVVTTMDQISSASAQISNIISVIDGIAFQTNILALNAAVEAARAGDHGRGFAVVASEVRSLSHRSAEAAKEIKQLITDAAGKISSGVSLVSDAGNSMKEISESVRRMTTFMSEIGEASAGQSEGIEQVNQAVALLNDSTQQSAAQVEQAAAAAQSLEHQANQLYSSVSRFTTGRSKSSEVMGLQRVANYQSHAWGAVH